MSAHTRNDVRRLWGIVGALYGYGGATIEDDGNGGLRVHAFDLDGGTPWDEAVVASIGTLDFSLSAEVLEHFRVRPKPGTLFNANKVAELRQRIRRAAEHIEAERARQSFTDLLDLDMAEAAEAAGDPITAEVLRERVQDLAFRAAAEGGEAAYAEVVRRGAKAVRRLREVRSKSDGASTPKRRSRAAD